MSGEVLEQRIAPEPSSQQVSAEISVVNTMSVTGEAQDEIQPALPILVEDVGMSEMESNTAKRVQELEKVVS